MSLPTPYTVAEAAEAMRCSVSSVYRLVETNQIRFYRVGKSGIRITDAAIAEHMSGVAS